MPLMLVSMSSFRPHHKSVEGRHGRDVYESNFTAPRPSQYIVRIHLEQSNSGSQNHYLKSSLRWFSVYWFNDIRCSDELCREDLPRTRSTLGT